MNLETLKLACADKRDRRAYLRQPVKIDGKVYAANGSLLIAALCHDEGVEIAPNPELAAALNRTGILRELNPPMLPNKFLLKTPEKIKCPHCGGKGKLFEVEKAVKADLLTNQFSKNIAFSMALNNAKTANLTLTPSVTANQACEYLIIFTDGMVDFVEVDDKGESIYEKITIPDSVWANPDYWVECQECDSGLTYPHPLNGHVASINNVFIDHRSLAIAMRWLGNEVYVSQNSTDAEPCFSIVMQNDSGDAALIMSCFFKPHQVKRKSTNMIEKQL